MDALLYSPTTLLASDSSLQVLRPSSSLPGQAACRPLSSSRALRVLSRFKPHFPAQYFVSSDGGGCCFFSPRLGRVISRALTQPIEMTTPDLPAEQTKMPDSCIEPPASDHSNPFITPAQVIAIDPAAPSSSPRSIPITAAPAPAELSGGSRSLSSNNSIANAHASGVRSLSSSTFVALPSLLPRPLPGLAGSLGRSGRGAAKSGDPVGVAGRQKFLGVAILECGRFMRPM